MSFRAPHHKYKSSPGDSESELAAAFGSLRTSSNSGPSSTAVDSMHDDQQYDQTVVRFEPQTNASIISRSAHDQLFTWLSQERELLDRARKDLDEQNQVIMYSKVLGLADQVSKLSAQHEAATKKQAESDQTIKDLRQEVASLKTQVQTHDIQIMACKQLMSDRSREFHKLTMRIEESQKSFGQQSQQQMGRLSRLEDFTKSISAEVSANTATLDEHDTRMSHVKLEVNGPSMTQQNAKNTEHISLINRGQYIP